MAIISHFETFMLQRFKHCFLWFYRQPVQGFLWSIELTGVSFQEWTFTGEFGSPGSGIQAATIWTLLQKRFLGMKRLCRFHLPWKGKPLTEMSWGWVWAHLYGECQGTRSWTEEKELFLKRSWWPWVITNPFSARSLTLKVMVPQPFESPGPSVPPRCLWVSA